MAAIQEKQLSLALQTKVNPTLQAAYNNGAGIVIGAGGPVAISNSSQATSLLTLTKTQAGAGDVLAITNNGTGNALKITQTLDYEAARIVKSGSAGGDVLYLSNAGTGSGLNIYQNANGIALTVTKTTGAAAAISVANSGTGYGVSVTQSAAGTSAYYASVNVASTTTYGLQIVMGTSATARGIIVQNGGTGYAGIDVICSHASAAGDAYVATINVPLARGLYANMSTSSTGDGVYIAMASGSTGYGLEISGLNEKSCIFVISNNNAANVYAVNIQKLGTGTGPAVSISNNGADNSLFVVGGNAVAVAIAQSNAYNALSITKAGAGYGIDVSNSGGRAGNFSCGYASSGSVYIAHTSTNYALYTLSAVLTGSSANYMVSNSNRTGSYLLELQDNGVSTSATTLRILQAGSTGTAVSIAKTGTGAGVLVDIANAGTGIGFKVTSTNTTGGVAYFYDNPGGSTTKNVFVIEAAGARTGGYLFYLYEGSGSTTSAVGYIYNGGTGPCLSIQPTSTDSPHIRLAAAVGYSSPATGDIFRTSTDSLDCLSYYNGTYMWRHNIVKRTDYTGDATLTTKESGTLITNSGAAGTITLTLPSTVIPGTWYMFVRLASQTLYFKTAHAHYLYWVTGGAYGNGSTTVGRGGSTTSYVICMIVAVEQTRWATFYAGSGWSYDSPAG